MKIDTFAEDAASCDSTQSSRFVSWVSNDGGSEYPFDFDADSRLLYIQSQTALRTGMEASQDEEEGKFPNHLVIQHSLERYFKLVGLTLETLDFTEEQIAVLLNANPSSNWNLSVHASIATVLADHLRIERIGELPVNSKHRLLLKKLLRLTPLENIVLLDVCERFWRNPKHGSIADACAELGLKLTQ